MMKLSEQVAKLEEELDKAVAFFEGDDSPMARLEASALLAIEEQETEFCPACDAGVGHCNGPHN